MVRTVFANSNDDMSAKIETDNVDNNSKANNADVMTVKSQR